MNRGVVIVAPHFPPSNLTAGHRTRLFLRHLPEFGYEPTVLTVGPRYYEGRLYPAVGSLVPRDVSLVRALRPEGARTVERGVPRGSVP